MYIERQYLNTASSQCSYLRRGSTLDGPRPRHAQRGYCCYCYDGLGRRISKTVRHPSGTTITTHYGWDGDLIVREETGNQHTTVVYEPDSFVPMLRINDTQQGQVLSAYITDALPSMQLAPPTANLAG